MGGDDEEKEVKERVGGQHSAGGSIELPWRTRGRKSEAAVTEVRRKWRDREVVMFEETCLASWNAFE